MTVEGNGACRGDMAGLFLWRDPVSAIFCVAKICREIPNYRDVFRDGRLRAK